MKKVIRILSAVVFVLLIGVIAFLLYASKDDIKANASNIDSKLSEYYNSERLGGFAVSVFSPDSIIYMKGFGFANVKNKISYSKNTQQMIASISKTTIGISLLKAEEMGLLKVEDPVNKYLPFELTNPNFPQAPITLQQLATHTSSLDYNEKVVESLYLNDNIASKTIGPFFEDYLVNGKYGEVKFLNKKPGSTCNYSNIGPSLIAYIIELVSKMPFHDFSKKYIFEPLEMKSATWFDAESDLTHYANYYKTNDDGIEELENSGVQLYPSRDLILDIDDLTKFCQAVIIRESKLLTDESFEKLLNGNLGSSVDIPEMDNSGLLFMIKRNVSGVVYSLTGMRGGDSGIYTMMWFDPKIKLG